MKTINAEMKRKAIRRRGKNRERGGGEGHLREERRAAPTATKRNFLVFAS